MSATEYTAVRLPSQLVELCGVVVETNPLAFRSRSEFIVCAIRDYMTRVEEHAQRVEDHVRTVAQAKAMAQMREEKGAP